MRKMWIALLATTLGAGVAAAHEGHHDGKASAAPSATVSGELVDMACYLDDGSKGAKHAKCAGMCVQNGAPLGLLTADGKLYLVVANHANEKPYGEAKALAGGGAKLTGRLVNKGGVAALIVDKTEKP